MAQAAKFQDFATYQTQEGEEVEEEEEEEEENQGIELSLGLSLNGRFGVDPIRAKKKQQLTRSSSIPDFLNPTPAAWEHRNGSAFRVPSAMQSSNINLVRTCSLPAETEEEWRKRKEVQTLRRMEAKRKRSEKQQRNSKAAAAAGRERSRSFGEESLFEAVGRKDNGFLVRNLNGLEGINLPPAPVAAPSPQGSIGSQGSGSSGLSESESLHAQGVNKGAEARSPNSVHSLSECERKPLVNHRLTATKSGSFEGLAAQNSRLNESMITKNGAKGIGKNELEDMPCVSTKFDGPSGRRIEGFLYRYRRGEEVKIVCVCHGNFFSPAEFVKHAGGGDVTHPLKHIVVSRSPLL